MANGGQFFINSAQSTVGALAGCYVPENSSGNANAHSWQLRPHPDCGTFVLKPRRIVHHYEWDEFVDYVDWRGYESLRASHRIEEPSVSSFSSCRTFEDAMRLAREGWDDIGEYMSRVYVGPQIQVPASIYVTEDFDTYNNIAGSSVNIGRYLRGAPAFFTRT